MRVNRAFALCALLLLPAVSAADEAKAEKASAPQAEERREKTDANSKKALAELRKESPAADKLYGKAYGYAAFSSVKVAVGVSGGGGSGVAVNKSTGARTYMKMGTAGIGLALGAKKYHIVFLFEDQKAFDKFVEEGWQADTSASATAGTSGAGVASTFSNGMAVYQLSEKGLMAQAEIAGTKYWKSEKLN